MIDEKLKLSLEERNFLKRVVDHWHTKKEWLVCTGDTKDWGAGTAFSMDEKLASRKLICLHLIDAKIMPSTKQLFQGPLQRVNIANTSFEIPQSIPVSEQCFFDWLFRPTKKGLHQSFVEEL